MPVTAGRAEPVVTVVLAVWPEREEPVVTMLWVSRPEPVELVVLVEPAIMPAQEALPVWQERVRQPVMAVMSQ